MNAKSQHAPENDAVEVVGPSFPLSVPAHLKEPTDPGSVIGGKYRVEKTIGTGGFGIVLLARHVDLGQRAAVKLLRALYADEPVVHARFQNEARAAAMIQSEHVVRVFDVSPADAALPYMVMEYLDGEDLSDKLTREGALPVQEAVEHLVEACAGVALAHESGVIHRDLKPSNLFLARRDDGGAVLKILDFGISKQLSSNAPPLTTTGALHGTPTYMAPEQLLMRRAVDARVDVWALGVILYELLTDRAPWEAHAMPQLVAQILHDPPTPPTAHRADIPRDIESIIHRCLNKEPTLRFESASELAEELARAAPSPNNERTIARLQAALERARKRTSLLPPTLTPTTRALIDASRAITAHERPVLPKNVVIRYKGASARALVIAGVVLGLASGVTAAMLAGPQRDAQRAASLATPGIAAPMPTLAPLASADPPAASPPTPAADKPEVAAASVPAPTPGPARSHAPVAAPPLPAKSASTASTASTARATVDEFGGRK